MSGTSLDGVDGVLAQIEAPGHCRVLTHASLPLPATLRQQLLSLNISGPDELHRSSQAAHALTLCYAKVVQDLLAHTGMQAREVSAIGAHGQTVRHQPDLPYPYTWQLQHPALLAELTGIDVVADFRSRDLAAGGQGAPLVPAFRLEAFGLPGQTRAILNIGGIANVSVLPGDGTARGWDCGPGNVLIDHWCREHLGQAFDQGGAWAAGGVVHGDLLEALLTEPYLRLNPPKSTGRELFNVQWLQAHLDRQSAIAPEDVQATLTAYTAECCATDLLRQAPAASQLIVCGGGALNLTLMKMLSKLLPGMRVESSEHHGLPPLQVEAAAFAWLACKYKRREPASLPSVTGASGARVLGALYPR
jgi:anhydro-N-acetylmuramic acid kinase